MGDAGRMNTDRAQRKRLAVLERDGRGCHVCGKQIDMNAPQNSRNAASLDHIVPLNAGGTNALDNLKLAHRHCNTHRNNQRPAAEAAIPRPTVARRLAEGRHFTVAA